MTNKTLDQLVTVVPPYQPTDLLAMLRPGTDALGNAPWNTVLGQLQSQLGMALLADQGAVNAYVLTPSPPLAALLTGQLYTWTVATTNTGPSTLNVSGLGAQAIIRPDGSPLQPGDMLAGEALQTIWNGSAFQLFTAQTVKTMPVGDKSVAPASTAFVQAAMPQAVAFRNRIINGDMRIDQRHVGAPVTCPPNNAAMCTDRWKLGSPSVGTLTGQQVATNGSWNPTSYSPDILNVQTTITQATMAAGDAPILIHNFEGVSIADLAWGTPVALPITISYVVRVSVAGDYCVSLASKGGGACYVHKTTLPANALTKVSFTVPGPTIGAWSIDNTLGINMRFAFGAGSSLTTATLDAWQPGNFTAGPTQLNMMATAGAAFAITDVQFEIGSVATPFERRPLPVEMQLCQRYFAKTYFQSLTPGFAGSGVNGGMLEFGTTSAGANNVFSWRYPVVTRASPIITPYSINGTPGNWSWWGANQDFGVNGVNIGDTGCAIGVTGTGFAITAGGIVFGHLTADAEL